MNPDPIGLERLDQIRMYLGSNPIGNVDPSGLDWNWIMQF